MQVADEESLATVVNRDVFNYSAEAVVDIDVKHEDGPKKGSKPRVHKGNSRGRGKPRPKQANARQLRDEAVEYLHECSDEFKAQQNKKANQQQQSLH